MAPRRPRRPASLARIRAAARDRLGFQALSEAQELAVRALLSGRDTLAVMPTGSGKSRCTSWPGR